MGQNGWSENESKALKEIFSLFSEKNIHCFFGCRKGLYVIDVYMPKECSDEVEITGTEMKDLLEACRLFIKNREENKM